MKSNIIRRQIYLLIFLLLAFNANASEQSLDAISLYNNAHKSYQKKDYETSKLLFSSFIKKYPEHDQLNQVYHWLGSIEYETGKLEIALDYFQKSLNLKEKAPTLIMEGRTHYRLNKFKPACNIFLSVMSGKANANKEERQYAHQVYEHYLCEKKLFELQNNHDLEEFIIENRSYRAFTANKNKDHEIAIKLFKSILNDYPDSLYQHEYRYRIGQSYFERGEHQKAIDTLSNVAHNQDEYLWSTNAFETLADIYIKMNNIELACEHFLKGLSKHYEIEELIASRGISPSQKDINRWKSKIKKYDCNEQQKQVETSRDKINEIEQESSQDKETLTQLKKLEELYKKRAEAAKKLKQVKENQKQALLEKEEKIKVKKALLEEEHEKKRSLESLLEKEKSILNKVQNDCDTASSAVLDKIEELGGMSPAITNSFPDDALGVYKKCAYEYNDAKSYYILAFLDYFDFENLGNTSINDPRISALEKFEKASENGYWVGSIMAYEILTSNEKYFDRDKIHHHLDIIQANDKKTPEDELAKKIIDWKQKADLVHQTRIKQKKICADMEEKLNRLEKSSVGIDKEFMIDQQDFYKKKCS